MVPRIIHCFWAKGPKTKLAEKCLASWRRFAPEWEIREWSLESIPKGSDLPAFCVEAIRARQWTMVSDWVRMWVLERFGGLYLDLDMELVRPIGALPDGEWVSGEWTANGRTWMNPGSGLALEPQSPIARGMLERYARLAFDPNREMMSWINANLGELASDLKVLPPEVMSPIAVDGRMHRTENTVAIHWYAMGCASPKQKILQWLSWHGFRPLIDALLRLKRSLS